MDKVLNSLEELLGVKPSDLKPNVSNWILLRPENGILPLVSSEYLFNKWRVLSHSQSAQPEILIEVTPRWVTITIHQGGKKESRREDFECRYNDFPTLIRKIFVH